MDIKKVNEVTEKSDNILDLLNLEPDEISWIGSRGYSRYQMAVQLPREFQGVLKTISVIENRTLQEIGAEAIVDYIKKHLEELLMVKGENPHYLLLK